MKFIKNVTVTKVGYMSYLESEIISNGNPFKKVKVFRGEKILRDNVQTINNIPIQISHNNGGEIVGKIITSIYSSDKKAIIVDIILYNDEYIGSEVSLGYEASLKKLDDTNYELINFIPNHLAIVSKGRCGKICKI